ncbi:MAG: VWA domain-containing protein [Pseudomonadota bacterium]
MLWFKRKTTLKPGNPIEFLALGASDIININVALDADITNIELICIGLDREGHWVENYLVNAFCKQSQDGALTLVNHLSIKTLLHLISPDVSQLTFLLSINGQGNITEWGKGFIHIKIPKHTWEWVFHGSQFNSVSILNAFSFLRTKAFWSVQIHAKSISASSIENFINSIKKIPSEEIMPTPVVGTVFEVVNDAQAQLKRIQLMVPHLLESYKAVGSLLQEKQDTVMPSRCLLVLDHTNAMKDAYENTGVQRLLEQIVLLSSHWNPSAEVDVFFAGKQTTYVETMRLSQLDKGTKNWVKKYPDFNQRVQFGLGMQSIRSVVYPDNKGGEVKQLCFAKTPTLVVWAIGHGVDDARMMEWQIRWASREPIFWVFIVVTKRRYRLRSAFEVEQQGGIGGEFSFLDHLHKIEDCTLLNATYLTVSNLEEYNSHDFYKVVLECYSEWVLEARRKGLLPKV